MYKDKDKQREANRLASQRRRDKGMTQGMTNQGMTITKQVSGVIPSSAMIPKLDTPIVTEFTKTKFPKPDKDIKCITIGDQARSIKMMAMLHSDACKQGKDLPILNDLKPQSHNPMMVGYVPPKE